MMYKRQLESCDLNYKDKSLLSVWGFIISIIQAFFFSVKEKVQQKLEIEDEHFTSRIVHRSDIPEDSLNVFWITRSLYLDTSCSTVAITACCMVRYLFCKSDRMDGQLNWGFRVTSSAHIGSVVRLLIIWKFTFRFEFRFQDFLLRYLVFNA